MSSVLVVEDERIVALDIVETLRRLGYEVTANVASADEALAAASLRCPDIALMDISIQGDRDGIETALLLRQRFGVAVVFLSAHADDATIERAKRAEPHGYLLKPFNEREMKSVLEIALYRHNLELGMASRDRWFSTTLKSIADAVIALEPDGSISFMNEAAEAFTGVSARDALGKRMEDVVHVEAKNAALQILKRPSGEDLPIEQTRSQILSPSGEAAGSVVVLRDMSERNRLEQRASMAEKLASIGTLAAGVAHEINNPLSYVIGNLDFIEEQLALLEEAPPRVSISELRAAAVDVRDGALRMRDIVSDLRLLAARDEGTDVIDLTSCIRWAVRVTQSQHKNTARVDVRVESSVPPIFGNESRLAQVLVNLIANAAQAIGPGHKDDNAIVLRAFVEGDRVVVSVSDTGPGIPPELQQRVFDPFFTTKTPGQGTGLGLAICQGIVRGLGGDISLSSGGGRGTTVRVSLPISHAQKPESVVIREALGQLRLGFMCAEDAAANTFTRALSRHDIVRVKGEEELFARLGQDVALSALVLDAAHPEAASVFEHLLARAFPLAERVVFLRDPPPSLAMRISASARPHYRGPLDAEPLELFLRAFAQRDVQKSAPLAETVHH